jgi:outer membrane protein
LLLLVLGAIGLGDGLAWGAEEEAQPERQIGVPPLTLELALELAQSHSPDLATYRQNVALAAAGELSAKGAFLPYLAANGSYSRIPSESFSVAGQTFSSPSENYALGASARLPLFAGFRNVSTLKRSHAQRNAAESGLDRAVQSVALAATKAFVEALKAEALQRVTATNVERSEEQLARIEALYEVGSVPRVDLLRQRGQLGSDKIDAIDARNATERARNDLNLALGLAITDRRSLAKLLAEEALRRAPEPEALPDLVAVACRQRSDLNAQWAELRAAEAERGVARSGYWPTVDLTGNYSWNGVDFPGGIDDLRAGDSYSVGVSLNVPIFDRWLTRSNVQQSAATIVYRRSALQNLEREIARQVATARLALVHARERVEQAQANLETASEELRLAEEEYAVGAATLLERNVAAASHKAAAVGRVTALYDWLYAKVALAATVGDPTESWLDFVRRRQK